MELPCLKKGRFLRNCKSQRRSAWGGAERGVGGGGSKQGKDAWRQRRTTLKDAGRAQAGTRRMMASGRALIRVRERLNAMLGRRALADKGAQRLRI